MNIQIHYTPIVTVGTNPQRRSFRKTTSSASYPAIELVITNDDDEEDLFISLIELELNKLHIPFCSVSKTKPIKPESDFIEKVSIEKLIEDYNAAHNSNINSLIGSKIIVTDSFDDQFESEKIDY